MLYSIISNDNVLYFNLKLFHKKYEKIKEFFANEVMKYFYFKTENKSEKMKIMQSNLSYIFNNVLDKSLKKNDLNPIYNFWFFLKDFLSVLSQIYYNLELIIILDQYRDISSDNNYKYLNDFITFIYQKKHKIIISSSVNNYNIQSTFSNNINYLSFESDGEDLIDDKKNLNDVIQDEYDVKKECDFYEKILNKKYSKMIDTKINIETIAIHKYIFY